MQSNDLFTELGQVLSSSDFVQVLTALRQEPLVWQSLESPEFLQNALDRCGSQPHAWNPGALALLALGESWSPDRFAADPVAPLGKPLQEKALHAFQNVQRTGVAPTGLREAGLLALALRERRRLTGGWSGLLQEVMPRGDQADAQFVTWRAALTCAYGLVPDPVEMLRGLLPKHPERVPFAWIIHIELSQPLTRAEHVETFLRLLTGLPVPLQLGALRLLSLSGNEALAAEIADKLIVGNPGFPALRIQSGGGEIDLAALSTRALQLQQMGSFYHLAGDRAQALALYGAVETALEQWLSGLYLQRLNIQVGRRSDDTVVMMRGSQISHLASSAGWLKNELGVVLLSHPYASSVLDQMQEEPAGAFLQLKRALEMLEHEPALARDLGRQGAAALLDEIRSRGVPFSGEFVYAWRPQDAIQILLDLDLAEEALEASRALLQLRPADVELLHITSRIYERLGRYEQGIQLARTVAALEPLNPAWRRALGRLWGLAGDAQRSLAEWEAVLSLSTSPTLSDRLTCARAALKAGVPEEAARICDDVLADDANNGAALGLMGQAMLDQGQAQAASAFLVRATLLSPELLEPWLALAGVQEAVGEPQRAMETLRAAVTAVPEAPEAHLALGRACSAAGQYAEALPHLKKAFQLAPESEQAALLYGRTLRALGHPAEARAVLEQVRSSWMASPELAFAYAQVLLDLNDAESALPVLEMALRSGLPVLDGYLLYARILLGEYRGTDEAWDPEVIQARLQQADQALHRILEIDPNNLDARFLMADLLRGRGDLRQALEMYRALAELPGASATDLHWRIQWGMGRTAMCLGETETALAALKEACASRPDSIPLHRVLAEACMQAHLPAEAVEAAGDALELAPDDVDNLAWYATFIAALGENRRAVEALERAVQINPRRADLLISLAELLLAGGDLDGARVRLKEGSGLAGAGRTVLRRAGQVYLRLEDRDAALVCFERALQAEQDAPVDLLYELAQLYKRLGRPENALEAAQRALEKNPDNLPLYLLQADLLADLNRPQAALALLERALRAAQNADGSGAEGEPADPDLVELQGQIHERFTRLMIQSENLPAALFHAETALEMNPTRVELVYQAADLALALLQTERAWRIVQSAHQDVQESPLALLDHGTDGLNLFCLEMETRLANLESGLTSVDPRSAETDSSACRAAGATLDELAVWIDDALARLPESARLLACKARLVARRGSLPEARGFYASAARVLAETGAAPDDRPLWMAEAALEVQRWKEALLFLEQVARARACEARASLSLVRGLVIEAEQQRLCALLHCRSNNPGAEVLSEERQKQCEAAVEAAARLVTSSEITRWQIRAQAVFAPSAQAARALAGLPASPEDTAALVMALREINNRAAAVQIARRYPADSAVLLRLALCYLGEPAQDGIEAARKVVSVNHGSPLAHAALALLSRQAASLFEALEEYETALALWPDEPEWHDAAGDLCMEVDRLSEAVGHRKQALACDPASARYAFKLGGACLALGKTTDAIIYLEKVASLEAAQPAVWLELARAYRAADRLPQAMEAARQASTLDPNAAEGLLIAGEIALEAHDLDLALDFARSAVRREPENPDTLLFYSRVLVMRNRAEEGLSVLESAAPAVKNVFPVAIERAKLIRKLHGPQAALELLEKLTKDYGEEPQLLGFLARTEAECGGFKDAERYAFKALRLDPNQPELTLMLGRLQRKTGQLDQAVHLLSEAVRMAPDRLENYLELASVYQERRENAQALQVYKEAMRVAPADYQAYYQSGVIMRDSKDYAGAEAMLRRAADLAPENLGIRRQLVAVIALNLVHSKQEASL